MRIVLQRAKAAKVVVEDQVIGAIDEGFVLLVGFGHDDNKAIAEKVANKILSLRIFEDADGKMNESLDASRHGILAISQFTLYANVKKGRRPSFIESMGPQEANDLYEYFCEYIEAQGFTVARGEFGADMKVSLTNDGPVTIVIDSETL